MLIRVPEQSTLDLDVWAVRERTDALNAQRAKFRVREREAIAEIARFAERGPCYAGTSWGKDSTVIAHLVSQLRRDGGPAIPLVWVRVEPRENPHCALVRDAFFADAQHAGHPYEEIVEQCALVDCAWSALGTLERGFARAAAVHGDRYVSGIRASESGARKMRCASHGLSTVRTCAPIGWWQGADVFAYLHARGLPVHPAYAMSFGGQLDRDRIRVASLGGLRGSEFGRSTWEYHYYGRRLDEIGHRAHDWRPR